jgi:hypothetical protein
METGYKPALSISYDRPAQLVDRAGRRRTEGSARGRGENTFGKRSAIVSSQCQLELGTTMALVEAPRLTSSAWVLVSAFAGLGIATAPGAPRAAFGWLEKGSPGNTPRLRPTRPPASLKAGPPASRAVSGKIFAEFFCAKFPWIPAYPRLWVRSGDDRDTRQFERGRPPGTERLRAAHSRPFAGRSGAWCRRQAAGRGSAARRLSRRVS